MARGERRDFRKPDNWQPFRWPVELHAQLREMGSCALPVKVVDISTTGCRVETGYRTIAGRPAVIDLGHFAPLKAMIVASDQWHAALKFDHPLHFAVLQHLVRQGTRREAG